MGGGKGNFPGLQDKKEVRCSLCHVCITMKSLSRKINVHMAYAEESYPKSE